MHKESRVQLVGKAIAYVLFLLLMYVSAIAQNRRDGSSNRPPGIFRTYVPARTYDIILSRPTKNSVTISILAFEQLSGKMIYGLDPDKLDLQSASSNFDAGIAQTIEIKYLAPNQRY